ncbi:UNVERIFIED_CONTAM: hypothetical protein GTU68_013482 [Idotea baltica]|nr:hypothetical protein [Idotea baltica]
MTEQNFSQRPTKRNKPLVLTVEDNPDVLEYIEACLEDDYTIIKALNGQEGIKMALEHNPDLILSDVMMPIMNGIDMTEQIRTIKELAHVPIILVTAMSTDLDKVNGLRAGANDYLTKPFFPDDLIKFVTKYIKATV